MQQLGSLQQESLQAETGKFVQSRREGWNDGFSFASRNSNLVDNNQQPVHDSMFFSEANQEIVESSHKKHQDVETHEIRHQFAESQRLDENDQQSRLERIRQSIQARRSSDRQALKAKLSSIYGSSYSSN